MFLNVNLLAVNSPFSLRLTVTKVVFEWVQLDTEGKIGKRLTVTKVVFEFFCIPKFICWLVWLTVTKVVFELAQ